MKHCHKEVILHERTISRYGLFHSTAIVTEVKTIHGNGATKSEFFIEEDGTGMVDQVGSLEEGFYYIEQRWKAAASGGGFYNCI